MSNPRLNEGRRRGALAFFIGADRARELDQRKGLDQSLSHCPVVPVLGAGGARYDL